MNTTIPTNPLDFSKIVTNPRLTGSKTMTSITSKMRIIKINLRQIIIKKLSKKIMIKLSVERSKIISTTKLAIFLNPYKPIATQK